MNYLLYYLAIVGALAHLLVFGLFGFLCWAAWLAKANLEREARLKARTPVDSTKEVS